MGQHFPATAKATPPTNGKHAPEEVGGPTNGSKPNAVPTTGVKADSDTTNGAKASAPPTNGKHTVPAGVGDGCN